MESRLTNKYIESRCASWCLYIRPMATSPKEKRCVTIEAPHGLVGRPMAKQVLYFLIFCHNSFM